MSLATRVLRWMFGPLEPLATEEERLSFFSPAYLERLAQNAPASVTESLLRAARFCSSPKVEVTLSRESLHFSAELPPRRDTHRFSILGGDPIASLEGRSVRQPNYADLQVHQAIFRALTYQPTEIWLTQGGLLPGHNSTRTLRIHLPERDIRICPGRGPACRFSFLIRDPKHLDLTAEQKALRTPPPFGEMYLNGQIVASNSLAIGVRFPVRDGVE